MSITFPTTSLKVPSGLTALPSGVKRPAFGTLYGYDAQQGGGGDGTATEFNAEIQDILGTMAGADGLRARTGDSIGTIIFVEDTNNLYVYDGANWQTYTLSSSVAP